MVTPAPPDLREHQVVFEASSVLESQMMLNLLQASGIEGQLVGAHLVGGIGELPATNLVKVLVAPESADEARGIIREWESRQIVPTPAKAVGKAGWLAPLLFGAAISAVFVVWFTYTPSLVEGIDLNGDGRADEQYKFAGERLVEWKMDRNFDGVIDTVTTYGKLDGNILENRQDNDFDGAFETTTTYRQGNPVTSLIDTDGDGSQDYRLNYQHGVLVSAEHLTGSGLLRKREEFSMTGVVKAAYLDSNLDGVLDTLVEYDEIGGEVGRSAYAGQP